MARYLKGSDAQRDFVSSNDGVRRCGLSCRRALPGWMLPLGVLSAGASRRRSLKAQSLKPEPRAVARLCAELRLLRGLNVDRRGERDSNPEARSVREA